MARDNHLLFKFSLIGIPPAPCGEPQIEVTLDIDTKGILNVSIVDKSSGKQFFNNKITNDKGRMYKEYIERVVSDAEKFKADDDKQKERIAVDGSLESINPDVAVACMANYRAKCQELLSFIPDLQCHKCKDVPRPNKKNRYSCVDSSHMLCEKDKFKCPCGSLVGKNPSPIIAKLLKDLPWMCQNYKKGCREMKQNINELEFHQRMCIFRKVYCPNLACHKESRVIMFKDVMKHLNDSHVNGWEIKPMLKGQKNIWMASLVSQSNFELMNRWTPGKMTSTSGDVFFFEAKMSIDSIHCWVNFLGSSDDAKNFKVNFSVDKSGNFCETFTYNGPVHTLETEQSDIIDGQICLTINRNAIRRLAEKSKCLNVKITIRNVNAKLEDEDLGESDDSEEKPTVKKRRHSVRSKPEFTCE